MHDITDMRRRSDDIYRGQMSKAKPKVNKPKASVNKPKASPSKGMKQFMDRAERHTTIMNTRKKGK